MNDILKYIDNIQAAENDSAVGVYDALISQYDKAQTILEYSDDIDTSSFSLFQEGKIGDKIKEYEKKDKSKVSKILLYIPRAIAAMFAVLFSSASESNIAKEIPRIKIEKPKQESFLQKIRKSKTIKIVKGISTAATVGTVGYTIIKTTKDSMKQANDAAGVQQALTQISAKRTEIMKLKPQYAIGFDEAGVLNIASTINLEKGADFNALYLAAQTAAITRAVQKIKDAKSTSDVFMELNRLQLEIYANMTPYEMMCDQELLDNPQWMPIDQFYKKLNTIYQTFKRTKVSESSAQRVLVTELQELYNNIPFDKISKGIINKKTNDKIAKEQLGAQKDDKSIEKIDAAFKETVDSLTHIITHDLNFVSGEAINMLRQISNIMKDASNMNEQQQQASKEETPKEGDK